MRYYVIINGVNSLTIEGLAIRTLPPISKPAMRNLREEIDGRDGDITTELGYGAYDKTLEIGLFGDYDINKIIAFFNSKGKIIFSDEPDKYYNFEIVDKIDYTKLVKFRTASINIHCQPFKYPVSEEPEVEEYEYVEDTGEALTLDNTAEAILNKIELIGNTEQTQYTGKNIIKNEGTNETINGITYVVNEDGSIKASGTATARSEYYLFNNYSTPLPIEAGVTYTNTTNAIVILLTDDNYKVFAKNGTLSSGNATKIRQVYLRIENGETINETLFPMISKQGGDYEPYVGGIPAPNPDYPEPIHVVSGDNTIEIEGKNFCNNAIYFNENAIYLYFNPKRIPKTFTISLIAPKTLANVGVYAWVDGVDLGRKTYIQFSADQKAHITYTLNDNDYNAMRAGETAFFSLYFSGAGFNTSQPINEPQIEGGAEVTNYTPYIKESYPINLGNVEMASSPNGEYRDFFSKEEDKWYINKVMKKITLTGTENWTYQSNVYAFYNPRNDMLRLLDYRGAIIADHFTTAKGIGAGQTETSITGYSNGSTYEGQNWLYVRYDGIGTAQDLKNYFANNNTIVFYPLVTPTKNEITNETLIDQLEAIKNAVSYSGQTNVSQTNDDAPFILDLSALKEGSDHLVINNAGNIYAMPTMDIEGTGVVDIYLNDVQILEADLSETNNIVIDTEAMEAYNPDTNALANRQITGDYSKIKLEPGENDLRFSGALSKATITDYTRWL